jgi:hypothetical protein
MLKFSTCKKSPQKNSFLKGLNNTNTSIEEQINEPIINFRKLNNANSLLPQPRKQSFFVKYVPVFKQQVNNKMKNILPVITHESLARNRMASMGLKQREVD